MAKIRYLNIIDIFSLKKLVSHITNESFFNYTSEIIFHPLKFLNYLLPIRAKFISDSYVSVQDGSLKGMLSIKARTNNHKKWRIKRLLLDENSYEIGEQLINYAVSKYGAKGVETVEVEINSNETDMIDLFSKACGFRYCMDYQFYEIKTAYYKNRNVNLESCIIRPFKPSDADSVSSLYNDNIITYYKFPLSKTPKEFRDSIFKGLYKKSLFKYILEDKFNKQIRGYVQIETENNHDFVLEIVLLPSFENYFEDMLTFATSQIEKRANKYNLYFRNNKFQANSQDFESKLSEIDNDLIRTDKIFVKDFFRQIKEDERLIKPAMIYNELKGKPVYKI